LSELVQAADESFSMHRRLDPHQDRPPLESCSNPFQLKKRKVSIYSSPSEETHFHYNADFLSAIFQDVADIIQAKENHIDPFPSQTAPQKKHRVSIATSLSRCSKSYGCLSCSTSTSSCVDTNPSAEGSAAELGSNNVSSVQFQDDDLFVLHNLPATISENSCSVVNLTQTSVRAAQVLENPPNFIYGVTSQVKDSYGWFVEIDEAPEDAPKTERIPCVPKDKSRNDISFTVCTAPKKNPAYDAAVEWAKAADTIDNVLGDLPF
jgi:hypothetical protein